MAFKLASLALVLFVCQPVLGSADDDYFKKAVFPALMAKDGQFSSHVKFSVLASLRGLTRNYTYQLEERHSFAMNTGKVRERKFFHFMRSNESVPSEDVIYINGTEFYSVALDIRSCFSLPLDNYTLKHEVRRWVPLAVYNNEYSYKILGPSVLLEVFYDKLAQNKQNVKCEQAKASTKKNAKKCSITFNETVRLDYSFFDDDEYTMYPEKIESHSKNETGVWEMRNWYAYSNFTAIFGGEPIVSADLPLGYGCRRVNTSRVNYPKIETNFGEKFELEYEVAFRYMERNKGPSYMDRRYGLGKYVTRNYTGKMFVDRANSLNIAEAIDEITNVSLRTFYNTKRDMLHQVTLNDNKCTTFNYTSERELNWFYFQDTFVKRQELYNATDNSSSSQAYERYFAYSYLQDRDLDGVRCSVFENKFYFIQHFDDYEEWYSGRRNSTAKPTKPEKRANKNKVRGDDFVITTHWYAKKSNNWPGNSNGLSVPKRIAMIINDDYFMGGGTNFLLIDIKKFTSSPKEFPKYDTSKCKKA